MTLSSSGEALGRPNSGEELALEPGTGDAQVQLNELYRLHSQALVRHLAVETGCHELARELTNEAFARMLRMAPSKLGRIVQPKAYLKRVSANLVRDWARARGVSQRAQSELELAADELLDQVAVLETRDTLRRLDLAIAKLKPRTREIFLAHRLDGLSYAEIAVRTGISVKGVEKQMGKAIAKIDRLLDRA